MFATAETVTEGEERAFTAAALVMSDTNLELRPRDLEIRCSSDPCLKPGSTVEVSVRHAADLPFVPDLFGSVGPTVAVSSSHLEVVDRFQGRG